MNLQEYISSGILETYVLGLASEEEVKQVQTMMAQHPEIKQEVEAIEASLISHAELQANEPSEQLRSKIISAVTGKEARVINLGAVENRKSVFYKYAAIITSVLFLSSIALNVTLYRNLKDTKKQLTILYQEKDQMAGVYQAEQAKYIEQLEMVSSPESRTVVMKGSQLSPTSQATVFWNKESHEVYINVNSLPPPPPGKQYQLWALADGQPIDAGVFNSNDAPGLHKMKNIFEAQAFAVTMENAGGSETPTLSALYVSGNI